MIFGLGMGSKGQNSTFSEHVMLHIKENHACSNIIANIFLTDTPTHLGMGSIGRNSTFSEHGHVAYQIKDNRECSNMVMMVAYILPTDPTPDPGY